MAYKSQFNENTRVQVPAAIHLCKLGYTYLSAISDDELDTETNILTKVMFKSMKRLNRDKSERELQSYMRDVIHSANNPDLGKVFYSHLSTNSGIKLIDFINPDNNVWHVTTELTCEDKKTGKNFRPDITCFINGIPVAFIEVKKPNNRDGILAERERINWRMQQPEFNSFLNVTQLMIFSNNEEYDKESIVPIQGAFYATRAEKKAFFNVFREADKDILSKSGYTQELSDEVEKEVLVHRNCITIKSMDEYKHNLRPETPTNRILTSMLSKERILFLLRYGIAYVDSTIEDEDEEPIEIHEKHIMRYQQMFATLAIRKKLSEGMTSGIIWHTQGSGKTALAYYNVRALIDYYQQQKENTPVKFYFIVDRIDLMNQASDEFRDRGLIVHNVSSRIELMDDLKDMTPRKNALGKPEITVVNIQKFEEEKGNVEIPQAYSIRLQRVFFIDEAHRGYNPKGTFFANLMAADNNAVKIALTGTPLLKEEVASWKIFGGYFDTYYYDKSIADGYTLRLMREDIETVYKEKIKDIIDRLTAEFEAKRKDIKIGNEVEESEQYLNALLDYVVADLKKSRLYHGVSSIGGMIVCKTNKQAKNLYELFCKREESEKKPLRAALILSDEGTKVERKDLIKEFKKKETIDFLIVNDMLQTGFDAPRLKKLYLCDKLRDHTLLQALTRVNRRYKDFKYGYIVDFANIKENFKDANNNYLKELKRVNELDGMEDRPDVGTVLIVSPEEIVKRMEDIKDTLWRFDTDNAEVFSEQVRLITEKEELYTLRRALVDAKEMANQVRSFGDEELKKKIATLKPQDLPALISEVSHCIDRLNLKDNTDHSSDVSGIIRLAIDELQFSFNKVGEEEMVIVLNNLKEKYDLVRQEFERNFDKMEAKYVNLADEFRRYFQKHDFRPADVAEARAEIDYMDSVMAKIREINRANEALKRKYNDDEKFVRVHKRIVEENEKRQNRTPKEKPLISENERIIAESLKKIKDDLDTQLYYNINLIDNQAEFSQSVLMKTSYGLYELHITAPVSDKRFISNQIINEYNNRYARV